MKINLLKNRAILLLLALIAHSCEKDYLPDCESGNCATVNIKGTVYDNQSGAGFNNIPVEVYFAKTGIVIGGVREIVVLGKTNRNGEFDFKATIDTKSFEDYQLYITIPEQNPLKAVYVKQILEMLGDDEK